MAYDVIKGRFRIIKGRFHIIKKDAAKRLAEVLSGECSPALACGVPA